MFPTQSITPEVVLLREEDFKFEVSKGKKAAARLHSSDKKSKKSKAPSDGIKAKATVIPVDDDDDDFVSPAPWTKAAKEAFKSAGICSAGSSDVFDTQNKVISNKRPSKVAKKFRPDVPKFIPYRFPFVYEAKQLKDLVLSKEYLAQHGRLFPLPNSFLFDSYLSCVFLRCS